MTVVSDLLGPVVVLIALVAIVAFMLRGAAPKSNRDAVSRLGGYGSVTSLGTFFNGMLAAIAIGTTVMGLSQNWTAGITTGACVGLLFVGLSATGSFREVGITVTSGLLGAIGFVVTVTRFFDTEAGGCTVIPFGQRVLVTVIILVALLLGGLIGWLRAGPHVPSPLAAFGALKVVIFLSTPFGLSLAGLGWPGWATSVTAAALIGLLAGLAPKFAVGFAGAVIAVAALGVSVTAGSACSAGPNFADLAPITGFVAVYGMLRLAFARFLR